jgi:hypothetical protein
MMIARIDGSHARDAWILTRFAPSMLDLVGQVELARSLRSVGVFLPDAPAVVAATDLLAEADADTEFDRELRRLAEHVFRDGGASCALGLARVATLAGAHVAQAGGVE